MDFAEAGLVSWLHNPLNPLIVLWCGGPRGVNGCIRLIFVGYFISQKQVKVGFKNFFCGFYFRGRVCGRCSHLPFAVFNFANGHRLVKYVKLNPPRNIRRILSNENFRKKD